MEQTECQVVTIPEDFNEAEIYVLNMTWQQYLAKLFVAEIMGFKRPEAGISTDLAFSTYFPQFIPKDPVRYDLINAFLSQLLSNDKVNMALIEAIEDQLASCDLRIVTTTLKGLMSPEMLKKLNGIQVGATNYTHPATHPATMIALDALHRFVTDTQINSWNNKADSIHGTHVPAPQTANNAKYLRNDNTWQTVTPEDIGAYTKDETYSKAEVNNSLSAKAPTANPSFTGTVTAPTLTVTGKLNIPGGSMWIA